MQITHVTYPQPDVCCVQVREDAAPYEAVIQQQYQQFGKFYTVPGYEQGKAPREAIERQVGAQVFRLEAINHLLAYEFAALQAQLCSEQKLVPLTEPEPHLISDDETGFVVECTFAVVPKVEVAGYTDHAIQGGPDGVKQLLAQVAAQCGVTVCDYAVEVESANRREAIEGRLREAGMTLADFLQKGEKTEEQLAADLAASVRADFAQRIVLQNIARQEGLLTTAQQLDEELTRMEAISEQNRYARTNPAAQRSIAQRLTNRRTLDWLRQHNRLEK
ncbi:MAG: hypothetical protein IJ347_05110 [Faecalibacterium sp.]|nr:hypothetical protein [Faecalibacterium sp.]